MSLNRRDLLALPLGTAMSLTGLAAAPPAVDETWIDERRNREVPVKVRWPAETASTPPGGLPVILFSHGLGGTREGGEVWGQAWAAAGFVVVHLQHPGSDLAAVRAVARSFSDRPGLRRAAGPGQLLTRLQDVQFALDEISRRQRSGGSWAAVRAEAVGMSGHSFGAHTTLGVAGQSYRGYGGIDEPRLAAFIAFSPSLPVAGDAAKAFARLVRPVLCVTGTRDDDVVGNGSTPQQRIGVYDALPAGHRARLVLQEADHMTFGGQTGRAVEIIPREPVTRTLQAQHHALVAAITIDWWRATLQQDRAAAERLVRPAGMAEGDRWDRG